MHLHLSGGQSETVHFPDLAASQDWYQNRLERARDRKRQPLIVNVPISDLDGEHLVVRANGVIRLRFEPQLSAVDDT